MAANFYLENDVLVNAFNKGGKFAKDYMTILKEVENMEAGESINFYNVVRVLSEGIKMHQSGKIEGIVSIDSTSHCEFCSAMRQLAADHPEKNIICGKCYDYSQETSFKAWTVFPRHWLNMKILSLFLIPVDLLSFVPLYTQNVRVNASGDIVNMTHAINIINIAATHPNNTITMWSKNNTVVEQAFDIYGKPSNLRYIQSSYIINIAAKKSKYADAVFTVYDDEHINSAIEAGAAVCNGKKCNACGWKCYKSHDNGGHVDGCNIAEILRDK